MLGCEAGEGEARCVERRVSERLGGHGWLINSQTRPRHLGISLPVTNLHNREQKRAFESLCHHGRKCWSAFKRTCHIKEIPGQIIALTLRGGVRCLGAPPERAKRAAWSAASRSAWGRGSGSLIRKHATRRPRALLGIENSGAEREDDYILVRLAHIRQ